MKKKNIGYNITALLLLICFWHLGALYVGKDFLPFPKEAFDGFLNLWKEQHLWHHFFISLSRILLSGIISLVIALPLGILMGRSAKIDHLLSPFIAILYPLPKIVFLPIFIVFLGLGNAPKVLIITLIIFFQILVVIRDGVKKVSAEYIISFQTLNQSSWQCYRHVILPAITGDILTALRITVGSAIAVLFFAETFASHDGLGYLILNSMEARDYPELYGAIIAMAILGVGLYALLSLAENHYTKWQKK